MNSHAIAKMTQEKPLSDGKTEACGVAPYGQEISEVELDHAVHPPENPIGTIESAVAQRVHHRLTGGATVRLGGDDELKRIVDTSDIEALSQKFKKYDSEKTSFLGLPPWIWWEALEVSKFGAKRYGRRNWQQCTDVSRYVDAMFRHLQCFLEGENIDPDSGLPHLAHALWNVAALRWFQINKTELMKDLEAFL
jgi:hypothetical protein